VSRHSAASDHRPVDEAPYRTAIAWGELRAAERRHRAVVWDRERPIPLGVTEPWPLEVAE
jgi:hypothetical protein